MRLVQKKSSRGLVTCSLCLRVHRGSEWTEAERVIREIRSYELAAPPRLQSAVCEECPESMPSQAGGERRPSQQTVRPAALRSASAFRGAYAFPFG